MPSLRPSSFVEGGAVPTDMNLLWKEVRYGLFNYPKKGETQESSTGPETVAAIIKYVSDSGQEFDQAYSIGGPDRYKVADDGKTIDGPEIVKSSNFALLVNALVNAGFPENKLPEDGNISVLAGLYAYHIGLPEPKRTGLERPVVEGQVARPKVLSVPAKILRLPWEKKGAKTAARTAPAAAVAAGKPAAGGTGAGGNDGADVTKEALDFVAKQMGEDGKITRQDLASAVFADLAEDPNRDAIASLIFTPAFSATLVGAGYKVVGETISK